METKLFLKKHQFWIGMALFVFGATYQVLNALNWGWWIKDLEPNFLAEGAIFNGLTIEQLIARDFGFLAAPLFAITLILLIIGFILLLIER
jgi:hypothetical protein